MPAIKTRIALSVQSSYSDDILPVHRHYKGQFEAQPARIYMDEEGRVWASYKAESDTSTMDEHHGRTLTWEIPHNITGPSLDHLIQRISPLLNRVYLGHSIEWDGSNLVGDLSDDALAASEAIEAEVSVLGEGDTLDVCSAEDWDSAGVLRDDVTAETTDEEIATLAAAEQQSAIEDRRVYLTGIGDYLTTLRDGMRDTEVAA